MSDSLIEVFESTELVSLRRRLRNWFKKHGRSLPWRETHDPYRIWISEIMLQQTTVKAVVPYFERFINRFPSIENLAGATETEVLQYWEGLGYYSRGRNLRKAAIAICEQHDAIFPRTIEELRDLPGIGRYTAGAIRSFAFDMPAPIVEANTLRLYCRLLNYAGDPRSRDGEKLLWEFADQLQPRKQAGIVNQALMELGSQVCTPNEPACKTCPVKMHCRSFQSGTQEQVPRKKERPQVTQLVDATVALEHNSKYLVRQRQAGERWEGLWDFIRFPVASLTYKQTLTQSRWSKLLVELTQELNQSFSLAADQLTLQTEIRHSVTRYRIRLICVAAQFVPEVEGQAPLAEYFKWIPKEELTDLPMPVTGRRFASLITKSAE